MCDVYVYVYVYNVYVYVWCVMGDVYVYVDHHLQSNVENVIVSRSDLKPSSVTTPVRMQLNMPNLEIYS